MLRVAVLPPLVVLLTGTLVLGERARAQPAAATITEVSFPVPSDAVRTALGDPTPVDRSQFLLELIRRSYDVPGAGDIRWMAVLDGRAAASSDAPERYPLPLTADLWKDLLGPQPSSTGLARAILASRSASLLYAGLLALDDPTRAWIAGQRALLAEIVARHSGTFVLAAPALRVANGAVVVPGGARAIPIWESLIEVGAGDPAGFVRAVLSRKDGKLAYFLVSMSQLTAAQIDALLDLDAAPEQRVARARRLFETFERLSSNWTVEQRPFSRPALDPVLLLGDLPVDPSGHPIVPGTEEFWRAAFADSRKAPEPGGAPVDLLWLLDQVFKASGHANRGGYLMVQFAARHAFKDAAPADALDAVRGSAAFPALTATLERGGVHSLAAFAAASRRADALSDIDDEARAVRAITQYQGAVSLVTRAAARGAISGEAATAAVVELSAIAPTDERDYDGKIVSWLEQFLAGRTGDSPSGDHGDSEEPGNGRDDPFDQLYAGAIGTLDRQALRFLAGRADLRVVEWEGTRYRLDFPTAEITRMSRSLGDGAPPYLSGAATLVRTAASLDTSGGARGRAQSAASDLDTLARGADWEPDIASTLERMARVAARSGRRAAPAARALADELLARGLSDLIYADAFGGGDHVVSIAAREPSRRHDLGLRLAGGLRGNAWWLPTGGADRGRDWRATGALLGLDVRLGELGLRRLSSKPPPRAPTLQLVDRRVLSEVVRLIEPAQLRDADRDAIVAAVTAGRARLAAARTAEDAHAIAGAAGLDPVQRSLLAWTVVNDREHIARRLSPSELFFLGGGSTAAQLHTWGSAADPRIGCLCLRFPSPSTDETAGGRPDTGAFASAFVDLNLRIAELLAELRMPAALTAPVLAPATLDFIEGSVTRYRDDRRGWVEFLHGLKVDRVEQYLALLTTDGPLVPGEPSRPAHAAATSGAGARH